MAKPDELPSKIGGVTFFFALAALALLSVINLLSLTIIIDRQSVRPLLYFGGGLVVGLAIGHFAIRGRISVFLHELKHAVFSHFVGNRDKGISLRSESGHFEYAYSKATAHMNVFIALAPYWLPLVTVPVALLALCFSPSPLLAVAIVGIAYGTDCLTGLRDASPHQSDLTIVRGGFPVSIAYLFFSHLLMFTIVAAWASSGVSGLKLLLAGLTQITSRILGY